MEEEEEDIYLVGSRKARGRAILYGTCFQANLLPCGPDIWWVIYVGDGNGERRCHTKHHGSNAVYFSVFGGASRVGQERQWLCRARGCGYSLLDSWANDTSGGKLPWADRPSRKLPGRKRRSRIGPAVTSLTRGPSRQIQQNPAAPQRRRGGICRRCRRHHH